MNTITKSSLEVNTVYKTNDLSIFKEIKGNRPPNPQHVGRLANSIKKNGILQNPIIVNNKMQVIDGQHRLLAARESKSSIFYIIVNGYSLNEVHCLNLNQKNWTKKDYMHGYVTMGIKPYVDLKNFYETNKVFNLRECISMCSNRASNGNTGISSTFRKGSAVNSSEVFEMGTWKGRDFGLAQENADKIKMLEAYYDGYRRSTFVGTMLGLLANTKFNFFEFLSKLKLQSGKLQDCTSVSQYLLLIEDIYNYRRREKVNLRYQS